MAVKAKKEEQESIKMQKVFIIGKAEDSGYASAFYIKEYEIPENVFNKYAVLKDESNPDIFAIFLNFVTKKFREVLGI